MTGNRHGFSAFLFNGRIVFYFSDNEHYYLNPHLVSAASTPSTVLPSVNKKLCQLSERYAFLLQLKTGIFHIQYILHDGEPVLIEVCRRAPGDLYILFVKHATGVDYPAAIVKAASGMDCSDLARTDPVGYFTRHCIMTWRNGEVRDLTIDPAVQSNIIDQYTWWKPGDKVNEFLIQKFGIIFLRFNSMSDMLQKTNNMQNLIRVNLVR